ncbi:MULTISPECIES: patatin-like protein [Sphingomonadales]|uniref:Patatin-like phospholipase n=1 Tax=Edaphosphingomonas haloaromaticamans TaxID=653954 RepID=A0A1S1HM19_9SPHN|nr:MULTISPECIES: patatin-like protein [Sphingomonas]AGH49126.1 patatin [Sphingomonas sp. MM-1]OHT21550.1 Patatin-like phospholipase [Sphingomonas haloaromaticamans]
MREKELRLALVCYGGISLAVYMHGITLEVWRLARASRAFHAGEDCAAGSESIYRELLETIERETGVRLRVLIDIVAGASAGGINGVFLAQAIARGQSLEPLTELWLEKADVDVLLDPDARPLSRATKMWAAPIAWWAAGKRGGTIERTVDAEAREEIRTKLSRFVRARWFEPPFGGGIFSGLILDALDAMAETGDGDPLLPPGQPLDLFVTVTDFHGHPERLALNSPPEIVETEHRLKISFSDHGLSPRRLGDVPDLVFAARATASFPGAFPPFTVAELDGVLEARDRTWPGREAFLTRALPRHAAIGTTGDAVLIDGSVLANAPFGPATDALKDRPARREVDRRMVYIDPKPGAHSIRIGRGENELPGFFATIFGALSDIPREQPIGDNLDAIAARSARIRRMRRIVEAIRPEVEGAIDSLFGRTFFLDSPTPGRLAAWRAKAQDAAARRAGYAYAAYGHLKLSGVVEDMIDQIATLAGGDRLRHIDIRRAIWAEVRSIGITEPGALSSNGASPAAILFFRDHDLGFRIRRLRSVIRRISEVEEQSATEIPALQAARDAAYAALALYLDRQMDDFFGPETIAAAAKATQAPAAAMAAIAAARDLRLVDERADDIMATALSALPKAERRIVLLTYLGFPFYDIATLPLIHVEGTDEFNPILVDRISPDDCSAIREGGAEATLKGIQFNSFGAFFSRNYRENDYLWGRLHGAERLIDIVVSALPPGITLPPGTITGLRKRAFRAILAQERPRLKSIQPLFDQLEREVG